MLQPNRPKTTNSKSMSKRNETIVEFLGWNKEWDSKQEQWMVDVNFTHFKACMPMASMEFHSTWSWLLGLIDALDGGEDFNFSIDDDGFQIREDNSSIVAECTVKPLVDAKENILNAIMEYIKWYKKKNINCDFEINAGEFIPWFFENGIPHSLQETMEESLKWGNDFTLTVDELLTRHVDQDDIPVRCLENKSDYPDEVFEGISCLGELDVPWSIDA